MESLYEGFGKYEVRCILSHQNVTLQPPPNRRVNPVDNLYASFPAFLYLDPTLAGKLLEPLLELQTSTGSGNATSSSTYAAPDLGS